MACQFIFVPFVAFLQGREDAAFQRCAVGVHFREERWLFLFGGSALPVHRAQQILHRCQHLRLAAADQVVASRRVRVVDTARNSQHLSPVHLCQTCGDEGATSFRALHDNRCVRDTGHDAIAPHEISLVGIRPRDVFCQQSAGLFRHAACRLQVQGGVDTVQTMGQNAHRRQGIFQTGPVCVDIHPIRKPANHQAVRQQSLNFPTNILTH